MKVVSCYYGAQPSKVYPAPKKTNCYFYCNNPEMESVCLGAGWTFVFDDVPLTNDYRISSLQSKKIKFLQFDRQTIGCTRDDSILYFDHKLYIELGHIQRLETLCKSSILIRNSPREKTSIQEEIDEAVLQQRYRETMHQTIDWARQKIYNEGYSPYNRIMNTGLILYSHVSRAQPLCDSVFDACWLLGQPECQIIWSILSQKYESEITRINSQDVLVHWQNP